MTDWPVPHDALFGQPVRQTTDSANATTTEVEV